MHFKKVLFLFLVLFFKLQEVIACPACKEMVKYGKEALKSMRFFEGLNVSILFMLSIPYLLVGGMGLGIYLSYRKSKRMKKETHLSEPLNLES